MASRLTKYDLENITDYLGYESFCNDLMSREGYKDIEPLGGFKDKGRDAILVSYRNSEVTIFCYSVREDWKKKLFDDLTKIKTYNHKCERVIYVTTGSPTANEKDELKRSVAVDYGWVLEIYDLERIGTLVDNQYQELKNLHQNIFLLSTTTLEKEKTPLDRKSYANHLLKSYQEWLEKYTPLLAEHRELESLVIPFAPQASEKNGIPVLRIPEDSPVSILLGESGSGKTTALWRIIVEMSNAIIKGQDAKLPVLINLRSWNANEGCKGLFLHEFVHFDVSKDVVEKELKAGNCLVLFDGLNELSPIKSLRKQAIDDIQRFLVDYSSNRYIISCRTSDYDPSNFNLEQFFPRVPKPKIFEIKRLDLDQIIDYVNRYFRNSPELSQKLLDELGTSSRFLWENKASLLHLARVPLYLQLIITEFKREQKLPRNKAQLLSSLLHRSLMRESAGPAGNMDRIAKEELLSSFAYASIIKGYSLRIPDEVARYIFKSVIQVLKNQGLIQSDMTLGVIWQEVISNNYIRIAEWRWVEWLHQLILDYFLGRVITRIYSSDEQTEIIKLNANINKNAWEQACVISLGMIDPANGAKLLNNLLDIDLRMATFAYENQSEEQSRAIADALIQSIAQDSQESRPFSHIVLALPYRPVIDSLFVCFRGNNDTVRKFIAEAISEMVIKYYPLFTWEEKNYSNSRWQSYLEFGFFDRQLVLLGVKRGLELLSSWINNRNDYVRFFAAKGLWEKDKGKAAQTLGELWKKNDPKLKDMITDLQSKWGIE